jgi:hypothetical protein
VRTVIVWVGAVLYLMLAAGTVTAQTSPAGTSPPSAPVTTAPVKGNGSPESSSGSKPNSLPAAPSATRRPGVQASEEKNGTSNDRLFWTLPNFLTVENAHEIAPLTSKQKFKVALRTAFDPVEYPYIGFLAGISQATDSEPGYGQGAAGYAKRYGSAFADNTIENFMTGAILPSVLHQDPRYYQLGQGTFKHRLGYAISRIFVTRGDSGHNQFNASEVLGSAISAGIGTYSYHPAEDRTLVNTVSVWWTQIGWDSVAIGVKEFWPDIRRKVQKRHQAGSASQAANPQDNSGR